MNCQRCRVEIEELEAGERLTEEARAHLSVCHVCRAFHDERQSLKKLIGSLGAVSAPPDFDFRLRARLASAKAAGNHRASWRSLVASAPAIGLAASFALIVAAVVFYKQMKPETTGTTSPSQVVLQTPEQKPENESAVATASPTKSTEMPDAASPGHEMENPVINVSVNKPRHGSIDKGKHKSRPDSAQAANSQQGFSNDSALGSARVITPDEVSPLATASNPLVEVPVRSASQPMRVFIDDRDGAKRAVTLKPVIFGSQDVTGRNNTLATSSQGIW